ncbi:SPFH domain-containing protein [Candidatus Riflebacteria bacterium]
MPENKENDLILAPNEFAYISDTQSGIISVIVGPNKKSLAGTDQLIFFNTHRKVFEPCTMKDAIQYFPFADDRSYVVLQNPASDEATSHPKAEKTNQPVELHFGGKINIKGPTTFPLWPGQIARVIEGHQLRSNQYLLVQVYNEKAAREYWKEAVMKKASAGDEKQEVQTQDISELTTGQLLIIKGTEISFYIPPTGIEVLMDEHGNYVRNAVTIERLQYCILLDESGDKRYVRGPAVVFPSPTETFITRNGKRVYNAIELNENMGLYIKVIADYKDKKTGKELKAGEEIFITGEEQKIYFPCAEHAIIKYGDDPIHYAVAIPSGEARYILNKKTGEISMVMGPKMYLPNPEEVVLVRRILDEKLVKLWFPGNQEALEHNKRLLSLKRGSKDSYVLDEKVKAREKASPNLLAPKKEKITDELQRKTTYTPPRTLTLDTKYDGAVNINVWPGFAVQVVSNTGRREVIEGPKCILLEYDQILEAMELSTSIPKTDQMIIKTSYLRIKNNRISDLVIGVTKDFVDIKIGISYRVNFEGDPKVWFDVENYVKFLTEHCRSMIRNSIKRYGIEEFVDEHINIIRDTILGKSKDKKRAGRFFPENGMKIYDVEVLHIAIGDEEISKILTEAQHNTVALTIKVAQEEKEVDATKKIENFKQEAKQAAADTVFKELELKLQENKLRDSIDAEKLKAQTEKQKDIDMISKSELTRKQDQIDQALAEKKLSHEIETTAYKEKMTSIQPKLVEALIASGDRKLATKLAENLPKSAGPLGGLFGGGDIKHLLSMVKGTKMEKGIKAVMEKEKKEKK